MTTAEKSIVRLSTKGQFILPKPIRQRRQWDAGTRLLVEDRPDGVLLTTAPAFQPARPQDVFGSLRTTGPARTVEEMDAGVLAEAKRRHAGD